MPDDQEHIGSLIARLLENLIQAFHAIWRTGEHSDTQLAKSIDQKSFGDAYRFRHAVVLSSRTFLIDFVSLRKYGNHPWRRFQKRLRRIYAYLLQIIQSRLLRPTTTRFLLFCLRRLADRALGVSFTNAGKVAWLVVRTARR